MARTAKSFTKPIWLAVSQRIVLVNYENIVTPAQMRLPQGPQRCPNGLSMQRTAEYHDDLGEIGDLLHLEVDDEIKPVEIHPRRVPEALRKPVKDHLGDSKQQGTR